MMEFFTFCYSYGELRILLLTSGKGGFSMEFTLKKTDVFDYKLYEKVTDELRVLEDWYDSKLVISYPLYFHQDLIMITVWKSFMQRFHLKKLKVITFQNIVSGVLSFQLQKVIDAFRK